MELQLIEKADHDLFVQNLINSYRVEGVKRKDGSFLYGPIKTPEELCLDFDCTAIPPKKYFLPPKETLLQFALTPDFAVTPVVESKPFILFGVHPYDIKAISQMDRLFSRGVPDPHYLKRREATFIIGVDPATVAPRSFWADMGGSTVSEGFDLMFTDMGKTFIVEIGSNKGRKLLEKYAKLRPASRDDTLKRVQIRSRVSHMCKKRGLTFPKRKIPKLLEHSWEKPLWEEQASKCLSCGTCNLVCPTCYCFDIQDHMDLDLIHGKRTRRWDGCLLHDFAMVATGDNFRETRASRYRHRFFRKGLYLFKVLDDVACVGCGRCASGCLPDIADPVNLFNKLREDEK